MVFIKIEFGHKHNSCRACKHRRIKMHCIISIYVLSDKLLLNICIKVMCIFVQRNMITSEQTLDYDNCRFSIP